VNKQVTFYVSHCVLLRSEL